MTLKHHGSGLADLENALEYNSFFFTMDRKKSDLVAALNKLYVYAIIAKYVPENINIYISKIFWISASWMRIQKLAKKSKQKDSLEEQQVLLICLYYMVTLLIC